MQLFFFLSWGGGGTNLFLFRLRRPLLGGRSPCAQWHKAISFYVYLLADNYTLGFAKTNSNSQINTQRIMIQIMTNTHLPVSGVVNSGKSQLSTRLLGGFHRFHNDVKLIVKFSAVWRSVKARRFQQSVAVPRFATRCYGDRVLHLGTLGKITHGWQIGRDCRYVRCLFFFYKLYIHNELHTKNRLK